ncbi:MAG: ComEC/Rec2 family competence protein [Armatimonadota bacterium]
MGNLRYSLRIIILAVLVLMASASLSAANLTLSVIDVGQGDSIFIEFPNEQNMLIDAGDREHGQTVVKYLQSRHARKIDILVASHPHEDHIGGMEDVLSSFNVGKAWDSGYNHGSLVQKRYLQTIMQKKIKFSTPKAGYTEKIGDVRIDVLAPVRIITGTDSDANNNCLVLRITYGSVSFLLPGDMESEERATVRTWLQSTVLKVSHHGSRNGTNAAFLKVVAPKIAVISVAAQNDYGHPHPEVLKLLQNTKVYTTAKSGTVVISTDGKTLDVKTLGATVTAPPTVSGVGEYIGNVRSHVLHRSTCSSLPAEKNRIKMSSRDDAIAKGYKPCGRCKP